MCIVKSLTKAALVHFILEQKLPIIFTVKIRKEIETLFDTIIFILNPDATTFARNYSLATNDLLISTNQFIVNFTNPKDEYFLDQDMSATAPTVPQTITETPAYKKKWSFNS
uniref:Uncharacterized protein n=1 Tax=Strongyloides venezuelensis TaxID=75913 RepID=A0A0K0FFG6_STRVS